MGVLLPAISNDPAGLLYGNFVAGTKIGMEAPMTGDICLDCKWLDTWRDYAGRPRYWCVSRRLDLQEAVIWNRACEGFTARPGGTKT
jgi:hypothetical protein